MSLRQHYPSVEYLHRAARARLPRFSYDYVNEGTGSGVGVARNRSALDLVALTPRYLTDWQQVKMDVELFGRSYSRPFGIAPMGLASLQWPNAELHLAPGGTKGRYPGNLEYGLYRRHRGVRSVGG